MVAQNFDVGVALGGAIGFAIGFALETFERLVDPIEFLDSIFSRGPAGSAAWLIFAWGAVLTGTGGATAGAACGAAGGGGGGGGGGGSSRCGSCSLGRGLPRRTNLVMMAFCGGGTRRGVRLTKTSSPPKSTAWASSEPPTIQPNVLASLGRRITLPRRLLKRVGDHAEIFDAGILHDGHDVNHEAVGQRAVSMQIDLLVAAQLDVTHQLFA